MLVTAGPTREWLDPVRFISNPSTGVMGYEIARAARRLGHAVTLASGPTALPIPKGLRFVSFESAGELDRCLAREFPRHDVLFMTAAIGDYMPVRKNLHKIKRKTSLIVRFKQTPDLLAKLARKKHRQIVVGFCLETEHLIANALRKLRKKRLDFIVANFLGRSSKPFGTGRTSVALLDRWGGRKKLSGLYKRTLAARLLKEVLYGRLQRGH